MYFQQIIAEGLGCFSYVIGCPMARKCVVVDPKKGYTGVSQYIPERRNEDNPYN